MISDDPDPANCLLLSVMTVATQSDTSSLLPKIIFLFVLILINAFFSMSEIAIISLNDNKIKKMADEGHVKAKKIVRLTSQPSSFLSTIQIGVTLSGFLASASAATSFVDHFGNWIINIFGELGENNAGFISGFSLVVVTLLMSYFSLVLGELVPKRIAMQNPEKVSFSIIDILLFVKSVMRPLISILTVSTNLVIRIFGIDPQTIPDTFTEEEIRMIVDVGEKKGVIEESQKERINNIFEFDDISVEDIMTHRTEMVSVEITDTIETVVKEAINAGLTRIPVFEDDLDNIVGVINIKDLLSFIGQDVPVESTIKDLMRPAYFVPDSKKCGSLFTEMTEKHIQMAIVVDEYGGTAGLITMEDLIESILGNIQDEYDNEDEDIEQLLENIFTIDGTTDIEEVSEILDRNIPEGDYDTLGGMIMFYLSRIPSPDEKATIEIANTRFTVESLDERRIDKVRVEKLPIVESSEKSKDKNKD